MGQGLSEFRPDQNQILAERERTKNPAKNGTQQLRRRNALCLDRLKEAKTTTAAAAVPDGKGASMDLRRQAMVQKFELLMAAQSTPVVTPVEDAMDWVDVVATYGTCLYNEHAGVSSSEALASILHTQVDPAIISELVMRISDPQLHAGAGIHLRRLLFRCFWSGTLLYPATTLRWMPLLPCRFNDVRNMVAVHYMLRRTAPVPRIETQLPKNSHINCMRVRSSNADVPLLNDAWNPRVDKLPAHRPNPDGDGDEETVFVGDTGVRPRKSVRGWIARVYVYLLDKYGPAAFSQTAPCIGTEEQVMSWLALSRTQQEINFEMAAAHLTGDYNPLVLMDGKTRLEYASKVFQRMKDPATAAAYESNGSSNEQTQQDGSNDGEQKTKAATTTTGRSRSREVDTVWTVLSMYSADVVEIINNQTQDVKLVVADDPSLTPEIQESISAFMETDET